MDEGGLMRAVKLFIACSLDGFIARKDDAVDWLFHDNDYGMSAFYKTIDTALIGRKTYDLMVRLGLPYYKGKTNYVFSCTKEGALSEGIQYVSGDIGEFVESLRKSKGKDIWLVGGSFLIDSFLKRDLIDEIILAVHPVILGEGIPLFKGGYTQTELALQKCIEYESGLVQLRYRRKVQS
jgi:dihydrofolate reductase